MGFFKKKRSIFMILLMSILMINLANADLSTNLIGYYAFEDTSDSSTYNHTLTEVSGITGGVSGVLGDTYQWDGTDDRMYAADIDDAYDAYPWMWCSWIYLSSSPEANDYIIHDDTIGGRIDGSNNLVGLFPGAGAVTNTGTAMSLTTWEHWCVSANSTHMSFYLNGALDAKVSHTITPNTGGSTITSLGWNIGSQFSHFKLDEFAIYSGNPTGNIVDLYNGGLGCNPVDNPTGCNAAATPGQPVFDWDFTFNLDTNISGYTDLNITSNPLVVSYNGSQDYSYNIPDFYAYWRFNETANLTEENWNFNLTNSGTELVNAKYGKGLYFDGTDDYLTTTSKNLNFSTNNISISLWVTFNETNKTQSIIANTNELGGYVLYLEDINRFVFTTTQLGSGATDDSSYSNTTIYKNNWYYVTATYNLGEYPKIYINGVLDSTDDINDGVTDYSSTEPNLYIGTYYSGQFDFEGILDDVRLYNRTLSAAEIGSLYNSSTPKYTCDFYDNDVISETITNISLSSSLNQDISLDTSGMQETHNLTLTCYDTLLTDSNSATNIFIDAVSPIITLNKPTNNTVYYKGFDTLINISIFCDDPNLFSCNITLAMLNSTGLINQTLNNTFYDNIASTNQTANILRSVYSTPIGKYYIIAESADSHTSNKIKDYKLDKITDGYLIENKIKITSKDLKNFNLKKEKDRYTFDMDFNKANPEIYVECSGDISYLPNSNYNGHLVCFDERKWIDFENDQGSNVLIQKVSKNKVKVTPLSNDKSFKFKSIGDLNINKQIYTIYVNQSNFAFGMTIYDEDNPTTQLLGTAEVEFSYYAGASNNLTYYYADLSGDSNYAFNISTNESYIRGDMYIKYTTPNGFTHRYITVNTTYNTTTGYNFTLYNFNYTTGISDLKITARYKSNYQYYPDVIARLQRRYISEGVWRTVQMDQSGDFGVLFFNIKEQTTDYRIIFLDTNNNILKTTDSLKFICESGICDLTTLLDPFSAVATSNNITASYSYSNLTKLLNFTWANLAGLTSTVRMRLRQDTITGATYPCDSTQTGASGVYSCNMTGRTGMFEVTVIGDGDIILNDIFEIKSGSLGSNIDPKEGAFWTALIMIICVTFGLFSPAGVIITSVIGMIAVYLLGIFTPLTATLLIISTVIGLVIAFKVKS